MPGPSDSSPEEVQAGRWPHELAAALRRRGVPVPTSSLLAFVAAADVVGVDRRSTLYWAARATLVTRPSQVAAFDAAFAEVVDASAPAVTVASDPPDAGAAPPPGATTAAGAAAGRPAGVSHDAGGDPSAAAGTVSASWQERLTGADPAAVLVADRAAAADLVARLRADPPLRRSRRRRPSRDPSAPLDLGRTLRGAVRTGGEPLVRHATIRADRRRRLVLLADVSGSMRPYAPAVLRFLHAVVRSGGPVEAFALGTRLTRLTPHLRTVDGDAAVAAAAAAAADWGGGTRLAEGLRRFNDGWGRRGAARGALAVVVSDGWDTGDPAALGAEMARLRLMAQRVVWANPLAASPGFAPTARGMAAALDHVDALVAGHSVDALARTLLPAADAVPAP